MAADRAAAGRERGCESVLALVLANGRGRALEGLTAWQTNAAVPFGGQYRIVDFVLSNCVNSEIRQIALLTQYKSQSLIRHVHSGWGFLHRELGEFIEIWPAQQQDGERWYRGTVDAVYQNLDLIEATGARYVLVLAGDQIYSLDYSLLIEAHIATGADLTVACAHTDGTEQAAIAGPDWRLERIERLGPSLESRGGPCLAPMGAFVFSAEFLAECLRPEPSSSATADFARDLVPSLAGRARVFAHICDDREEPCPWRTLNTIDRYWRAHMELLDDSPLGILGNPGWPVFTRYEPLPSARVLRDACVDAAVLSPGAVVAGDVTHSVISTRCRVGANAIVRNSVLLPGAVVGHGCVLDRVIVDCDCVIPPDTRLGLRFAANSSYYASPEGIVLATAERRVGPPPGATVRKIA
jgi:glucose-1-phosphate adenylyltransferase